MIYILYLIPLVFSKKIMLVVVRLQCSQKYCRLAEPIVSP